MALMFSHLLCWLWWKLTLLPPSNSSIPLGGGVTEPMQDPKHRPPLDRQINWKLTVVTKRRIFPWHLCGSLCLFLSPYPEFLYIYISGIECVPVSVSCIFLYWISVHYASLEFRELDIGFYTFIYTIDLAGELLPVRFLFFVSGSVFGSVLGLLLLSVPFRSVCALTKLTHARQQAGQQAKCQGLDLSWPTPHCVFGHNQSIAAIAIAIAISRAIAL